MEVKQEEWHYRNGNEKQSIKVEDCVLRENKTRMASDCPTICLPINAQSLYEENINRPKCQNGFDHMCMMKHLTSQVRQLEN